MIGAMMAFRGVSLIRNSVATSVALGGAIGAFLAIRHRCRGRKLDEAYPIVEHLISTRTVRQVCRDYAADFQAHGHVRLGRYGREHSGW